MNILIWSALLVSATLTSSNIISTTTKDGQFELLILHNNDMHARFEQTSQLSAECKDIDRNMGKCYGGFARVATVVKEARKAAASGEGPPVLYLNAGDTYTGTAWFTIYKWKIAAEFINALQPDAIALGNNEFTAGNHEPSPFLNNLNTPILSSNVLSTTAVKKIQKSVVFEIEGVKVGIIGYLGLDKSVLDNSLDLEYIDEVLALKEEVANLQSNNVNIIIALGHSDPSKDIEIAQEVEGIDLVLGGHKNVFYWNGTRAESSDEAPITVLQKSGKKVPVFHSYAYNEHLGKLTVKFDKQGEIKDYNAEPILLDASIPLDTEVLDIKKKYSNEFTKQTSEIIGETAVVLDGESCKNEECNLGNFITDAIVYCNALTYESSNPWTDAPIAIIHGGAIASSIAPSDRPAPITRGDLLSALPTEGNLVSVTMSGAILLQVLENAASEDRASDAFLQYSGIRVVFDYSKEVGSRVVSAVARCGTCWVPGFNEIENTRSYTVIMPGALLDGFGYSSIFEGLTARILPIDEVTCTTNFIQMRSPVYPEVAERIVMYNKLHYNSAATATSSVILLFVAVTGCLYNY